MTSEPGPVDLSSRLSSASWRPISRRWLLSGSKAAGFSQADPEVSLLVPSTNSTSVRGSSCPIHRIHSLQLHDPIIGLIFGVKKTRRNTNSAVFAIKTMGSPVDFAHHPTRVAVNPKSTTDVANMLVCKRLVEKIDMKKQHGRWTNPNLDVNMVFCQVSTQIEISLSTNQNWIFASNYTLSSNKATYCPSLPYLISQCMHF